MTYRAQPYPRELRERAVRMVAEVTPDYGSQWAAINAVAQSWVSGRRRRCARESARPRPMPVSGPGRPRRSRPS